MNIYYALKREPLNHTKPQERFVILGKSDRPHILITKTADNPVELARRYHAYLRELREKQIANVNNHFLSFEPPEGVRLLSLNQQRERKTDHFLLEELTQLEREEFESTLMKLSS